MPGLVDCHRHSWEAQLRRINPNSPTLADYSNATHLSFAKFYRPQDHYVGNYLTAMGCIDAGITCVIDNSHNSRSAAHSDAAIEALFDSGIRAVHASGPPGRRRVGSSMAAGSRAAAEAIFLVRRSACDAAHVLRPRPRQLGIRTQARAAHHHRIPGPARGGTPGSPGGRQAGRPGQHVQPLRRAAGAHLARFSSTAAPTSMSARARMRNMRWAKASAPCSTPGITASSRASASTTKRPTAPTCSWKCASRSICSARWRRTGGSRAIKIRRSR